MVSVTDINGVGPAKADTLAEEGYDSVEALAEADQDELAAVDGVGDDRALEFIVQAQDLAEDADEASEPEKEDSFDLQPKDVSDEIEEIEEEDEPEVEEEPEPEPEPEVEEEPEHEPEEETFTVSLEFDTKFHYDVYHAALMRQHESVYTSHQPKADTLKYALDELTSFDSVEYELDRSQLNNLHSAVLQQRRNYQGGNDIEWADALQEVENQINEQRDEYLF